MSSNPSEDLLQRWIAKNLLTLYPIQTVAIVTVFLFISLLVKFWEALLGTYLNLM